MLTPYQFASNRPIDGIDLDGLEFSKSNYEDPFTGTTVIVIELAINLENEANLSPEELANVKVASQKFFDQTISSASNANTIYRGNLKFKSDATITGILKTLPKGIGGASFPSQFDVAARQIDEVNNVTNNSVEDIAMTITHEGLHNAGLVHPTSIIAENDVRLTKDLPNDPIDRNFSSTGDVYNDIYYNVMLYGIIILDGLKVNDIRGSDENAKSISQGQMKTIESNIDAGKVNGEPMIDNVYKELEAEGYDKK